VGPPAEDEVTVPQGSVARRPRAPLPPPRDTSEDSVTVTNPGSAYGVPTDLQAALFSDEDAVEHTVPGMRLPAPEPEPRTAVQIPPKPVAPPRNKKLLYGGGAAALVLVLVALVLLRLDGGLISSELPTFSELMTPSGHNPGRLKPLPEPAGDEPAPPPLERPLNQAKDPVPGTAKAVPAAQPAAQPAPTPSQPAPTSPTAATPTPAPAEDDLLAPLEASPAKPGTAVAESPAPKRVRTAPKKGTRTTTSETSGESKGGTTGSAQATGEPGQLTLVIEPFAKVYLGSRLLGETPLFKVSLPSGRHSLRLVGPDGQPRRLSVEIKPGDTTSLRMPLELLARE
jgi:hypothetical protein